LSEENKPGESRSTGLPPEAYQAIDGDKYPPYIPASQTTVPEATLRAIVLGAVLGIIFGAANAYLGLKVGMTVTASIPVAVISMGILRAGAFKEPTILENNIVQTVGSAGEAIAAGIVFTIPALIMMNLTPTLGLMFTIACLGGLLGVIMMIPLRRFLIVKEHGKLPYPEGTGCADVLVAGERGGTRVKKVFFGLGVGAIYKFFVDVDAGGLWEETPSAGIPFFKKAEVGLDALPSLLGVGFIIGPRISAVMLAGGALAWLGLIPLINSVGSLLSAPLYPETQRLISEMSASDIWDAYVRYIGAGAVALGGIVSLVKAIPTIAESFSVSLKELLGRSRSESPKRTQREIGATWVLAGSIAIAVLIWILPEMPVGLLGALLIVVFTFFFSTVASRIVGLIGGSSCPISGMTIATLLATALIFAKLGWTGTAGKIAAVSIGAIVCVGISTAADISQDLKTGFLLGATPRKQQLTELVGVVSSAAVIGFVILVLHQSFGIGSSRLPAPQANLMKMVVEGVMDRNLPWALVLTGVSIAIVVELLGVPSLPFAVGLYLPMSLSTPIMVGGLLRHAVERDRDSKRVAERRESGVLFSSGMIAGGATVGVLLAIYIYLKDRIMFLRDLPTPLIGTHWIGALGAELLSLGAFAILSFVLWKSTKD